MKHIKKLAGVLLLVLAIIACNGTAVQTVEVTRVVPQTVVVTEAVQIQVQVGGFTTGTPVDVSTLPPLTGIPAGGEPVPCFAEGTEPSINWGYEIFPNWLLCLNNFPTAPDSPGFTITLTDPTGRTFQETFRYSQGDILNAAGTKAGWVQQGDNDSALGPATPGVSVELYIPASFPCGNWSVSASTQDGKISAGPTPLTVECSYPLTSAIPDLSVNPFSSKGYGWEGLAFANHETIYIVGTAHPANTALTVALYQEDPAAGKSEAGYPIGRAKYAVSVMTDGSGNFQAPFLVGSATRRGAYYVIVAPTITADQKLYPFGARFSVE